MSLRRPTSGMKKPSNTITVSRRSWDRVGIVAALAALDFEIRRAHAAMRWVRDHQPSVTHESKTRERIDNLVVARDALVALAVLGGAKRSELLAPQHQAPEPPPAAKPALSASEACDLARMGVQALLGGVESAVYMERVKRFCDAHDPARKSDGD